MCDGGNGVPSRRPRPYTSTVDPLLPHPTRRLPLLRFLGREHLMGYVLYATRLVLMNDRSSPGLVRVWYITVRTYFRREPPDLSHGVKLL